MSSVDTRVVEMRFDNSQFEKGITSSMNSLQKLKASLDMNSAEKSLNSLQSAGKKFTLAGIGESVDALNKKFSTMGIIGMTAVSNITNNAINSIRGITQSVTSLIKTGGINRALNIEAAKFQLQGLGVAWDDISEDINYGVKDTAYGLDAAAKVAAQLVASGVTIGDTMKSDLRAISGVAAMTNSTYEEIGQIFTTIAGNGRLMSEQLLQFSSRGLNVAAALGTQLGKTESEIRDMVSKGEIDFQTFASAMDNAFGAHAKEANNTFTGALSNMKAALSRLGAEVASPGLESLRTMINALTPVINNIHTALMPVIDAFNEWFSTLSKVVKLILNDLDIDKYSQAISTFYKSLKPSEATLDKLKRSLNGVIAVLDIFAEIISVTLKPALSAAGIVVDSVGGSILDVTAKIGDMLSAFRDWVLENQVIQKGAATIIRIFVSVLTVIKNVVDAVRESTFIPSLLQGIYDAVVSVINFVISKFPAAANVILKVINAISKLFTGKEIVNAAEVVQSASENVTNLSDATNQASDSMEKATNTVLPKLKAAFSGISTLLSAVATKIASFVTFANAARLITIAIGVVMVKFGLALTNLVKKLEKLQTPMQALTGLINTVKGSVAMLAQAMKQRISIGSFKIFSEAVLMLAASVALLAVIPDKSGIQDAVAMIILLSGVMVVLTKTIGATASASVSLSSLAAVIVGFAASILILGAALEKLTQWVDSLTSVVEFIGSLVSLAGATAILGVFAIAMSKYSVTLNKSLLLLIPAAAAIYIFALSLEKLAALNVTDLNTFATELLAFFGYIAIVMDAVRSQAWSAGTAASLLAIPTALYLFAVAIKKLAKVKFTDVLKSIPALIEIIVAMKVLMKAIGSSRAESVKAAISLAAVSLAIDLMIVAVKAFGQMELGEIIKGTLVVGALELLFAGIIAITHFAGQYAAKAGVTLIALAVAIDMMAIAVALLSALDPEGVAVATLCVDSMIAMCAVLIAATKNITRATKSIMMLTILLGVLTACVALLSFIDSEKLIIATASLSVAMLALGAVFVTIGTMKTVSGKALAAIGIMMGVVAELSIVLGLLSMLNDADELLTISEALSLLLVSLAASMALAAVVGTIGTAATAGLVSLMEFFAIFGAVMGLVGSVVNVLKERFNVDILADLDTAIAILEKIGQGIGSAIGGVVDGFLTSSTQNLEEVATRLSDFATGISDFVTVVNSMDVNAVTATSTLVDIVKNIRKMTKEAANIGDSGSEDLSTNFGYIAEALVTFSEKTKGLDVERISKAAEATKYLTDVLDAMPKETGIWQMIFGTNNFSQLGTPLENYADALKKFNDAVTGENFDTAAIKSAAEASQSLVDLANSLPKEGGIWQTFTGTYDMSSFGSNVYSWCKWLIGISGLLRDANMTEADYNALAAANTASTELIEMAKGLDNTGGIAQFFSGEKDFTQFGSNLYTWMKYLVQISNKLSSESMDYDAIEAARKCSDQLIDLANKIPTEGGIIGFFTGSNDFSTFGQNLGEYADALVDFSDKSQNIKASQLNLAVSASDALVDLLIRANSNKTSTTNGMTGFSNTIEKYGNALNNYWNKVKDINTQKINSSVIASKQLAELGPLLAECKYAQFNGFASGVVSLGTKINDFYNEVKNVDTMKISVIAESCKTVSAVVASLDNINQSSFEGVANAFNELGQLSLENFKGQIEGGTPAVIAKVQFLMDSVVSTVKSYRSKVEEAANFTVKGFLVGINMNILPIQNAGTNLGKQFLEKLNESLDINSPSKETKRSGYYTVGGFLEGLSSNMPSVKKSATNMADTFISSFNDNMGIHSNSDEMINSGGFTIGGLLEGISNGLGSVIQAGSDLANSLASGFNSSSGGIVSGVIDTINGLIDSAKSAGDDLVSTVTSTATTAASSAASAASSAASSTSASASSAVSSSAESAAKTAVVKYREVGRIMIRALNAGITDSSEKTKSTVANQLLVGAATIKAVQESLKSSTSVFRDYWEATDDTSKVTKATLAEAANAFIDFKNSVKESLQDAASGFDAFEKDTETTAEDMISNLESQIEAIKDFTENIQLLRARGLSDEVLDYIVGLGVKEGSAYADALIGASNSKLNDINKLWKNRDKQVEVSADEMAATFLGVTETATKTAEAQVEEVTEVTKDQIEEISKVLSTALPMGISVTAETIQNAVKTSANAEAIMAAYAKGGITAAAEAYQKLATSGSEAVETVDDIYASMAYGSDVAKQYAESQASLNGEEEVTVKDAKAAKKAVEGLAEALWLQDDANKETNETLQEYQDELDKSNTRLAYAQERLEYWTGRGSAKKVAEWTAKVKSAENAVKKAEDSVAEYSKQKAEEMEEAYANARDEIVDKFKSLADWTSISTDSGLDIFEGFSGAIEESDDQEAMTAAENMIQTMQDNAAAWDTYKENLEKISTSNLSDELKAYLKNLGYAGADTVAAFVEMTSDQMEEANKLYKKQSELTSQTFLDNFKQKYTDAAEFTNKVQQLASKGVSLEFLQEVLGADITSEQLDAILNMDDDQWAEFWDTYLNFQKVPETYADQILTSFTDANNEATSDALSMAEKFGDETASVIANISEEIGKTAGSKLANVGDAVFDELATSLDKASAEGEASGSKYAGYIVKGIESKTDDSVAAGGTLATKTNDEIDKTVNKKSGKTKGQAIGQGIADGMLSKVSAVRAAASALAAAASGGGSSSASSSGSSVGSAVASGVASGMTSSSSLSSIASAGSSVVSSVISSFKSGLSIHSPSKVMHQLGIYTVQGFANGIADSIPIAEDKMDDLANTAIYTATDAVWRVQQAMNSDKLNSVGLHITPIIDLSNAQQQASGIGASLSSVIASNVNAVMSKSQEDRMINRQLSKDISNLSLAIAGVQNSLDDGSISNMNSLMEEYFPQFSDGFYLDGTKISNRVDSTITHNANRRAKVW